MAQAPTDGSDASTSEGGVYEFRRGSAREKTAHDGTIKKVLLDEKRQSCVSMGEDRVVRSVRVTLFFLLLYLTLSRKSLTDQI